MQFSDKPINFRTPFNNSDSNDRALFKLLLHNCLCILKRAFSFYRSVKQIRNAFCRIVTSLNFRSRVQQRAQLPRVLWRSRMAARGVTGPGIPLASRIAPFSHGKELTELIPAFSGGKYRNWDDVSMANAVEDGKLFAVQRSCITYQGRCCPIKLGPLLINQQPSSN